LQKYLYTEKNGMRKPRFGKTLRELLAAQLPGVIRERRIGQVFAQAMARQYAEGSVTIELQFLQFSSYLRDK
jgi:hypothetical protein